MKNSVPCCFSAS